MLAVSLIPDRRLERGKPRLDFIPVDEIAGVFQEILDLPKTGGGRVLAQAVLDQIPERSPLPGGPGAGIPEPAGYAKGPGAAHGGGG